jgi:hypothetical protein
MSHIFLSSNNPLKMDLSTLFIENISIWVHNIVCSIEKSSIRGLKLLMFLATNGVSLDEEINL